MTALLVVLGGGLGAAARHLVVTWLRARGATAAGAVLVVNATGSLLLGLVAGAGTDSLVALLGVGFCGAFTTFATHAVEVVQAAREGRVRHAVVDLALTLLLALPLLSLGWTLAHP